MAMLNNKMVMNVWLILFIHRCDAHSYWLNPHVCCIIYPIVKKNTRYTDISCLHLYVSDHMCDGKCIRYFGPII